MLTFDSIRDLERTERQSKRLQKLPEDIAAQIFEYLKRKERLTDKTSADLVEMENITSTIKRLMELREAKILTSAMDTVRTGLPPEHLTKDEETVFYSLTDALKQHREKFFHDIHNEPGVMYRVKRAVPAFIGPDMKTYELNEEEVVSLPEPLAELLIRDGVIEKA
ncbi:MAG TPA: hypothetical protein VJI12_03750 [archaeon]|nr:hypothetical protein [archaeon]